MNYNFTTITADRIIAAETVEDLFKLTDIALEERGVDCELNDLQAVIDWFTHDEKNEDVVAILKAFGKASKRLAN